MSWSDDTRCLYCDGKLPLYRKITSGQFCSAVHRKAYWQQQERLAVERLHQTHDSLRAYRSPEPPEAQQPSAQELWSPAASRTPLSAPLGASLKTPLSAPLSRVADFEDGPSIEDRARSASNTGKVTFAGFVPELKPDSRGAAGNSNALGGVLDYTSWPLDGFSFPLLSANEVLEQWDNKPAGTVSFFEATLPVAGLHRRAVRDEYLRLLPNPSVLSADVRIRFAPRPETPEFAPDFVRDLLALKTAVVEEEIAEAAVIEAKTVEPAPVELNVPEVNVGDVNVLNAGAVEASAAEAAAEIQPAQPVAVAPEVVEAEPVVGMAGSLLLLGRIAPQTGEIAPRVSQPEPLTSTGAMLARYAAGAVDTLALAPASVLMPLALVHAPRQGEAQLPLSREPQPTDLIVTTDAPKVAIELPALAPALRFAPGKLYRMGLGSDARQGAAKAAGSPALLDLEVNRLEVNRPSMDDVQIRAGIGLAAGVRYTVSFRAGSIEAAPVWKTDPILAEAKAQVAIVSLPAGLGVSGFTPDFGRLRPLAFEAKLKNATPPEPAALGLTPIHPANPPMQPVAKRTPIEGELQPAPRTGLLSSWSQAMSHIGEDGEGKHVWSHVTDFWQHAPRDLKLLSIAIPILLGLTLRPSLPKVRVTAPVAGNIVQGSAFERGLRERLQVVRQTVAERAGVELNEDFRQGLDDWQTRGDLSTAWSFDNNGFVKPSALALYRPSLKLSDYEMEFLGLIDKKALSWVVRAADFDNFYVVKLVVVKPGPMPTIGITRYAVINGKPQNRVDTVAAINARTDMLYRVNLNVRGDTYLLTLQGTVVDTWSESRLATGGIGFFAQQGEESRLRWVQVTHQYDTLGRLCAYLAPYNIPTTNGSW